MNNLHIMRFPRWGDVKSCRRTVMHMPMREVPNPVYHEGDVILAVNDENLQQVAILRVLKLSAGALMQFIGDVGITGLNDELMAVGLTWDLYKESWARTYHCAPEAETHVLRIEFGYEPVPLSNETLRVLEDFREIYSAVGHEDKGTLIDLVLEAARRDAEKVADEEYRRSLKDLPSEARKSEYNRHYRMKKTEK